MKSSQRFDEYSEDLINSRAVKSTKQADKIQPPQTAQNESRYDAIGVKLFKSISQKENLRSR